MITLSVFRSCAATKTPGVKKKMAMLENDHLVTPYKLCKKYQPLLLALAKSCRKVSEKKVVSKI